MASVVLPTFEWTRSCEQLARQIEDEDELLVVCDGEDDPVASTDLPDEAELIVAGEPEGCSGKANAVAAALERASQDRIVLTDDDVDRDDDWLATMKRLGEKHGAATAIPVFTSEEYPFKLLEPLCLVAGSVVIAHSNWIPWGGGVTFDRREIDEERYVRELRQTVSDDGLLAEYLDEVTASRALVNEVRVPGGPRVTMERMTRFVKIFYRFDPARTLAAFGLVLAVLVVGLLFPVAVAVGVTALSFGCYRALGVERSTWLFAVPALLLTPVVGAVGLGRRTFVWGGRRYYWPETFDVRIVE